MKVPSPASLRWRSASRSLGSLFKQHGGQVYRHRRSQSAALARHPRIANGEETDRRALRRHWRDRRARMTLRGQPREWRAPTAARQVAKTRMAGLSVLRWYIPVIYVLDGSAGQGHCLRHLGVQCGYQASQQCRSSVPGFSCGAASARRGVRDGRWQQDEEEGRQLQGR